MVALWRGLAVAAALAAAFLLADASLETTWRVFWEQCPNTDTLSPDPSLRFALSVDQYTDFREGRIFAALRPFAEAPTWPMLRNGIALVVFALSPTGPDPRLDAAIGFVFFALTLLSIPAICFELARDWLKGAFASLATIAILVHTRELQAYAASAMLETQGMFFALWTGYFLFKIYDRELLRRQGAASDLPDRRLYWGLFFAGQALVHTKYPYGLMLLIAWGFAEIVRAPRQVLDVAGFLLARSGWATRAIVVAAGLATAVYALSRSVPELNAKAVKYGFYFLTLLFLLAVHRLLWLQRGALRQLCDRGLRAGWIYLAAPAIAWIYLHPDRLSSTLGTQQRAQDSGRSYLQSLGSEVFDAIWPLQLLAAVTLIAVAIGIIQQWRNRSGGGWRNFWQRPLVLLSVVVIVQFAVLDVLTSNKQLRHIYHLMPIGVLLLSVWATRSAALFLSGEGRLSRLLRQGHGSFAMLACVACAWLAWTPPGIFSQGLFAARRPQYVQARQVCFTDRDARLFEPVRWMARRIDPSGRYVLLNRFHDQETIFARIHAAAPGDQAAVQERWLQGALRAWDFDVALRMRTLDRGWLRNDSPIGMTDWHDFDRLLALGTVCGDPLLQRLVTARASAMNVSLQELNRIQHPSGDYCMSVYRIIFR